MITGKFGKNTSEKPNERESCAAKPSNSELGAILEVRAHHEEGKLKVGYAHIYTVLTIATS
jgi:hypothetical protein